ncbi:MAG: hypothetical protein EBU84_20720 [Actinobacteria bacterium]|nr:hypothetical protein [Actinomycetota bacterium]
MSRRVVFVVLIGFRSLSRVVVLRPISLIWDAFGTHGTQAGRKDRIVEHRSDDARCVPVGTRCLVDVLTAAPMGYSCRYGAQRFPGDEDIPLAENPNWVVAQNAYDEQLAAMRARFARPI